MTVDSGPKKREASGVEFSSSKKLKMSTEANINKTQSNDVEVNGEVETLQNQQETPASSQQNMNTSCNICGLTFAGLGPSFTHYYDTHLSDFLNEKLNLNANDPICSLCGRKETSTELVIYHMIHHHGIFFEAFVRFEMYRSISVSEGSPEVAEFERLKARIKYSCFQCSKKYIFQVTNHICWKFLVNS